MKRDECHTGASAFVMDDVLILVFGKRGFSMTEGTKKYAHAAGDRPAGNDSKYCGQYCENAAGTTEISCNCGDAGCAVTESQPAMTA